MNPTRLATFLACALQLVAGTGAWAQSDAKTKPKFLQTAALDSDIARFADAGEGERIMAVVAAGSIECEVDAKADKTRISAEFEVDGRDAEDAARRAKLVKLYAERASDGTIIVDAVFPGPRLPWDAVKLSIVAPPTEEIVLKSESGTVRAKSTAGRLRASSRSGAIMIDGHRGSVDARTTTGRIEITDAHDGVQATSADGAIVVALADDNDHPFKVESRKGAVRVEVGPSFDGVVTMATTGGAISLVDPARRARSSDLSDTRRVAEIGAAAGQSRVETTSGAVTLAVREKQQP